MFKSGSTVPVKFALAGGSAAVTDAAARLSYARVSGNVTGDVIEAITNVSATSGNLFRYDPTGRQYVFNWSTRGLASGTYQLSIDLGDGASHTVLVSLK